MNAKHTPGPWRADAWNFHSRTTVRAGDETIAECHGHGRDRHQCEADARVIAAAPLMLEALEAQESLSQVGLLNAAPGQIQRAVELRRIAIAAATGEAA